MYKKDPLPDIQRLEQLVDSIRRGEIRLPKFQRPFVWGKEDMLNLWDSIYNGYPIGSVLLWHSSERLKSEREIRGFSVQESSIESYPTDYLLDGQQRLTTICGALYWDGVDLESLWAIHFDLDNEKFIYPKIRDQVNMFPLNKLLNTGDFIRQCMKLESTPNAKKYYDVAERLLRSVKDYKVAVVKIGDVSINEVAPIFERINSKGRKLTMVDLMRAATWKEGFDLTQAIIDFSDSLTADGFLDIPENVILRGVSAAAGFGINKGDIDKLRTLAGSELRAAFSASQEATAAAFKFLVQNLGLTDFSFLPYGVQLTHVAEFFRIDSRPSQEKIIILKRWLWATSITKYFSGASTGQNSRDLAEIRAFAYGEASSLSALTPMLDVTEFLFDEFNMKNASSVAFCLLLRQFHPSTDIWGRKIETTYGRKKNRNDFFDIFKETNFAGRNFGQVVRGEPLLSESMSLIVDATNHLLPQSFVDLSGPTIGVTQALERSQLISSVLSQMTGSSCNFTVPVGMI